MAQRRGEASVATAEWRMGYPNGPVPQRHPGAADRPGLVLGRPPMVVLGTRSDRGSGGRLDGVALWFWSLVAFALWIVVPCWALAVGSGWLASHPGW